ncbi:hypothetical protein B0T17DRAFT_518060 [Bombardia bombarda]|uniref:Zn(2)-C6 fungal-type domain-containing protein n=1 Tax=Bombardia bombarda TaxID=252184 RepID=A0AA39XMP9_9PEZI|nr:hypothetical protein B0T17DRAFT_518060 [Bombardia bombarda]
MHHHSPTTSTDGSSPESSGSSARSRRGAATPAAHFNLFQVDGLAELPFNTLDPSRQLRPHQKSRKGCLNCRKRHVKCDEQLPRCSHRQRRDEVCQLRRPPSSKTPSVAASQPPKPIQPIPLASPPRITFTGRRVSCCGTRGIGGVKIGCVSWSRL